ncbi:MAG: hypothetical protein MUF73_14155 [Rhodobacteraceae bacterium]|nr:hypothetical protein [Paracoccaceae bacterium]
MHIKFSVLALVAVLGLSACGDTLGEQAILGGVLGVGAAAATGNDLATGAVLGAGANVAACQVGVANCR